MRAPFACLLLFSAGALAEAADCGALLREAELAANRCDPARALDLYLEANRVRPGDPVVLQRIARQYSDLADLKTTAAEKKACASCALDYATQAVGLAPANAVDVLSLAICHGKLAVWSGAREKVAYSRLVKEEAERALALDPNYAWAHNVLGRWNYEVASLGPAERFFVRLFYGGLPPASCEQAIAELRRAVALEPGEPTHRLELGFAFLAAGRIREAREEFGRGLAMPGQQAHFEEEERERARQALATLRPASGDSQNG